MGKDGKTIGGTSYISTGSGAERIHPDMAYDSKNDQYVVVWETHFTPNDYDIYSRFIEEEGGLGTILSFANSYDNECNPNVIGSEYGMKFLVTWEMIVEDDYGSGPVSGFGTVGQEISFDGTDSGPVTMISTIASTQAALAAGATGDFLAVFKQAGVGEGVWGELWGLRMYLPIIIR